MGESISDYVAELRKLTTYCQYGAHLNEALRDRLVCGICDMHTQKKLLVVNDLTLTGAIEIAQAAERNAKAFRDKESAVNAVREKESGVPKACFRCGKMAHQPKDCWFRNVDCHHCGKRGHIESMCPAKKTVSRQSPQPSRRARALYPRKHPYGTRYVTEDHEQDIDEHQDHKYVTKASTYDNIGVDPEGYEYSPEDDEYLPLHAVVGSTLPYKVPLVINDVVHDMELDTGAAVTLMSESQFQELFPGVNLRESSVLLKTYSGEHLPVVGETRCPSSVRTTETGFGFNGGGW